MFEGLPEVINILYQYVDRPIGSIDTREIDSPLLTPSMLHDVGEITYMLLRYAKY